LLKGLWCSFSVLTSGIFSLLQQHKPAHPRLFFCR
jgi:hypothetical protein